MCVLCVCFFFAFKHDNGNKHTRDKIQTFEMKIGKMRGRHMQSPKKQIAKSFQQTFRTDFILCWLQSEKEKETEKKKSKKTFCLHFEWNSFYMFTLFTVGLVPFPLEAIATESQMHLKCCLWIGCCFSFFRLCTCLSLMCLLFDIFRFKIWIQR